MAPQGVHACIIYPVFCDNVAVLLTKIMVHFTSAMLFAPVGPTWWLLYYFQCMD